MTLANRVTLARICLIPLVIVFLFFGLNGLAVILYSILWFSDTIDGYIARRFNQVSDLGKLLDPLADKLLVILILIALVGLGKADSIPVMIITARELLVQGIRISSAKRSKKIIGSAPIAKLKAAVQFIAVFMLILSLPYAHGMLWAAVILSVFSGGTYLWQSKILKHLRSS